MRQQRTAEQRERHHLRPFAPGRDPTAGHIRLPALHPLRDGDQEAGREEPGRQPQLRRHGPAVARGRDQRQRDERRGERPQQERRPADDRQRIDKAAARRRPLPRRERIDGDRLAPLPRAPVIPPDDRRSDRPQRRKRDQEGLAVQVRRATAGAGDEQCREQRGRAQLTPHPRLAPARRGARGEELGAELAERDRQAERADRQPDRQPLAPGDQPRETDGPEIDQPAQRRSCVIHGTPSLSYPRFGVIAIALSSGVRRLPRKGCEKPAAEIGRGTGISHQPIPVRPTRPR